MKKILKNVFQLFVCLLFLDSCKDNSGNESVKPMEKEIILVPNTAKEASFSNLRMPEINSDLVAEEFAKLLASALKDKDLRKFLKDEANKKFDGDFDILFNAKLNEIVGNESFSKKLTKSAVNGEEIVAKAKLLKLLNISIPLLNDKWLHENQIPLVASANHLDEGITKEIKAFDKNGKLYMIDTEKEPDVPVIIISENERVSVTANGKFQKKEYLEIGINNKIKNSKLMGTLGYNNNAYLYLNSMSMTDVSHYESWAKGAPEIMFKAFVATNGFQGTGAVRETGEMEPSSRSAISFTNWFYVNLSIFIRDSSTYGKTVYCFFSESDTGSTYTLSLGSKPFSKPNNELVSLGVSVQIKDGDDVIGGYPVNMDAAPPGGNGSYYDVNYDFYAKFSN